MRGGPLRFAPHGLQGVFTRDFLTGVRARVAQLSARRNSAHVITSVNCVPDRRKTLT